MVEVFRIEDFRHLFLFIIPLRGLRPHDSQLILTLMRHNPFILCVCALTAIPFVAAAQNVDSLQRDTTTLQQTISLPHVPRKDSTRKNSTKPIVPIQTQPQLEQQQPQQPVRSLGRARRRVPGFRIQVYTGGNNRKAKQTALQMKERVQKAFPELSVYIHFQAPRWICRVGDFISREEAKPYLKELRKQRISPEANIVSSPVLRSY